MAYFRFVWWWAWHYHRSTGLNNNAISMCSAPLFDPDPFKFQKGLEAIVGQTVSQTTPAALQQLYVHSRFRSSMSVLLRSRRWPCGFAWRLQSQSRFQPLSEWYDDVLHHRRRLVAISPTDVVAVHAPPQEQGLRRLMWLPSSHRRRASAQMFPCSDCSRSHTCLCLRLRRRIQLHSRL